MMMNNGKLIVLSGPSGAGKSTVIAKLLELRQDVCFSISATTRQAREGEAHGVNYYFITNDEFENLAINGGLLEFATYAGNSYGTPKEAVEKQLNEGKIVLLDIEVQGALQVKTSMPEAIMVFLAPPNMKILEDRLRGRGTDEEEKVKIRLETAKHELAKASKYDYIVVNNEVNTAAKELDSIITAEKCKMADRIKVITEELELL